MNRQKQVQLPLSALTDLIENLAPKDWELLREWLDEKLAEYEDSLTLNNPRIMREIQRARAEHVAGKGITLKQFKVLQRQSRRSHV